MSSILVENNENGKKAYESLVLSDPKIFSVFNSKLAMKIVKALSESPAPAIDIARKLKIHEQKIYYHIRKLEKAGIVYTISSEKRHGMIANIYTVSSPVISAKLYEKGVDIKENFSFDASKDVINFFNPFIKDGNNFTIVVGNPYPHGKYETGGLDACYGIDLALFLGSLTQNRNKDVLRLDTLIREDELKQNLIVIGGPITNAITLKVNQHLPTQFHEDKNFSIISQSSKTIYSDDSVGMVIKMQNPFNQNKTMLLLGGKRTRGTQAAVLAVTKYFSDIFKNVKDNAQIVKIVKGLDENSDDFTDKVKIVE